MLATIIVTTIILYFMETSPPLIIFSTLESKICAQALEDQALEDQSKVEFSSSSMWSWQKSRLLSTLVGFGQHHHKLETGA